MDDKTEIYAKHLQGMVQIPTVSSANDEHTDWKQFDKLHDYLKNTYPLVFSKMDVIPVGKASLLFHWKSKNPKKLPVLLMAHQDVVPAAHPEQWTHKPFAGDIADGCVWGRGSIDCKSLLQCEFDTLEELIEEHFEPDFDIYLASGHNEEVNCVPAKKGAVLTAEYLKKQGVKLGCIFDEGSYVVPGKNGQDDVAHISLAEKAPNEFVLYKDGPGGHASRPGKSTILGDVARAMVSVEAHPLPYRLTPLVEANLKAISPYEPEGVKEIYADPKAHFKELCQMAQKDRFLDAKLHTTFALTMAEGSPQENVLPSHAECRMSVRILQGDTTESVEKYLEGLMPDDVKVGVACAQDPHPAGSPKSREFALASEVVKEVYGPHTVIVPDLMLGGTDSSYYSDVCSNIFKFSAVRQSGNWGESHQVDEHIPVDVLAGPVQFFKTFLKKY